MNYQDKLEFDKLKADYQKIKKELEEKNKSIKTLNKTLKQKEEVIVDLGGLEAKNKVKELSKELKSFENVLSTKDDIIKIQKLEIEDIKKKLNIATKALEKYKTKEKIDSSNSSKPSSTNGFKKVITNRREPSNKKQGGQLGHTGTTLTKNKVEYIKKNCEYVEETIDVNLTSKNSKKATKIVTIMDIECVVKIKNLKYYPDENGNYNIPKEYRNNLQYGENIKALAIDLITNTKCSIDSVKEFINSITNQGISLSKGTLINWLKDLDNKLEPVIVDIEKKLLESPYLNCDESPIKVDGENGNILCSSNSKYTRLWYSKQKTMRALKDLDFLTKYLGVIVKDGTNIYNDLALFLAQCISHILRYLKGIYDINSHKKPKEMADLLNEMESKRQKAIAEGKTEFSAAELIELNTKYDKVLNEWIKEWQTDADKNPVYDDERKLLERFQAKHKKEILYFLENFNVPFTNNQAESDLRPCKIKQKIGKFRSEDGAKIFANLRSCVNTYKKNNTGIYNAFKSAFLNKPVLV